jgi:hypothetical protein
MATIQQYTRESDNATVWALDDLGNTSQLGGNSQMGGVATQSAAAGVAAGVGAAVTGPQTVKFSLTSVNLLALRATPMQLIPAPGAGKFIRLLAVDFHLNFLTAAYTNTNANFNLYLGTTAGGFKLTGDLDAIVIAAASAYLLQSALSSLQSADANITNKGVFAGNDGSAEFLAGAGSLDIYLTYEIVTA